MSVFISQPAACMYMPQCPTPNQWQTSCTTAPARLPPAFRLGSPDILNDAEAASPIIPPVLGAHSLYALGHKAIRTCSSRTRCRLAPAPPGCMCAASRPRSTPSSDSTAPPRYRLSAPSPPSAAPAGKPAGLAPCLLSSAVACGPGWWACSWAAPRARWMRDCMRCCIRPSSASSACTYMQHAPAVCACERGRVAPIMECGARKAHCWQTCACKHSGSILASTATAHLRVRARQRCMRACKRSKSVLT